LEQKYRHEAVLGQPGGLVVKTVCKRFGLCTIWYNFGIAKNL